jgi:DNA repair exonuclease SbcCD ATPase subunit
MIEEVKKDLNELATKITKCIDVQMMFNERASRESWQAGYEARLNEIYKRLNIDEAKRSINYGKVWCPPINVLNELAQNEIKIETEKKRSQKHLEKVLKDRNEQIRVLEYKLKHQDEVIRNRNEIIQKRNIELEEYNNKNKGLMNIIKERESEIQRYIDYVKELNEKAKKCRAQYDELARQYDRLQTLRFRSTGRWSADDLSPR